MKLDFDGFLLTDFLNPRTRESKSQGKAEDDNDQKGELVHDVGPGAVQTRLIFLTLYQPVEIPVGTLNRSR